MKCDRDTDYLISNSMFILRYYDCFKLLITIDLVYGKINYEKYSKRFHV